eukprot:scaffold9920_cov32-Tisochrysis_lutea.AAC.1
MVVGDPQCKSRRRATPPPAPASACGCFIVSSAQTNAPVTNTAARRRNRDRAAPGRRSDEARRHRVTEATDIRRGDGVRRRR